MFALITCIQHEVGHSSQCTKAREIKDIQIGQEEIKLSIFTVDSSCMSCSSLCVENPTESTYKLLRLIHELTKVAGADVNRQKNQLYLYIPVMNNQKLKPPKNTIYNNIKINMTKKVQDLYMEY